MHGAERVNTEKLLPSYVHIHRKQIYINFTAFSEYWNISISSPKMSPHENKKALSPFHHIKIFLDFYQKYFL